MSIKDFEDTSRLYIRREPFEPFEVELLDGCIIEVKHPSVAFNGGAAVFMTPDFDLVDFVCENVLAIRQAKHKAASWLPAC
jgi:hypothetical protein